MKKIIIFIFLTLLFACSPKIMNNSIREAYNEHQLDSICQVENLPNDLDKWHYSDIYDYETHKKITQYVFIKEMNRKNETVYIITFVDSTYHFTKRVVKHIKK